MLTLDREYVGFRPLAILPIILFAPTFVSYAVAPGAIGFEYTGILFHVSILFLVSRMDGPLWAKAAGFGWLALDIATGALLINHVPHDIAFPLRLGGHVMCGIWMATVSLLAVSKVIRIVGAIAGAWLSLYTFVSPVLPTLFLAPASILLLVWFGLLAWKYHPGEQLPGARTRPAQSIA
ncbi:hypothetical protein [Amycolatopsis sp. H20-H5]|uniref:hypothetical protein n=1 Tax=Amycolatopsis sp. H20-H5 TaxID=3046309 RepID=UPI002DBEA909|nr:hypothetical protein [Amycolatopsis sp. H20-H5]MEC3980071.1 hypothetical protein [Amycolatopsis sp. H20-H5]